jgi:multidrug efflux system membrane fusion protein
MRRWVPFRGVVAAAAVWSAIVLGCSSSRATPGGGTAPAIAVRTAPVLHERAARPILATGVLAAKAEIKAAFKVGGIVASVAVREGATVRRGQVLAVLRSTEVDAAFEQVRQAAIKAKRDLGRVSTLYAKKAVTRELLDDATTAAAVARAQLRAAAFNRDHAKIRAPSDGRVLRRLLEPDEVVAPGQPVLVLSGDAAGWVLRAGLADRDVARVVAGMPVDVELSAWPDTKLTGTIQDIAAAATAVGTYQIEIAVAAPELPLRSGLIGKLRIEPPASSEVALIPAVALRDGDGSAATVWSVNADGSVAAHAVRVAFFSGDLVAIASGLDAVTAVVTDGSAYLAPGSRVQVTPSGTPTAAAIPTAPATRGAP